MEKVWIIHPPQFCCLYWHNCCQTDHSVLWWMVFWVNWLTLSQECHREMFLAHYCSSCRLWSIFTFWKISWLVMLMTPLWWPLCHPQALELLQQQSPWFVTLAGLVSGVTFGVWPLVSGVTSVSKTWYLEEVLACVPR